MFVYSYREVTSVDFVEEFFERHGRKLVIEKDNEYEWKIYIYEYVNGCKNYVASVGTDDHLLYDNEGESYERALV